MRQMQALTATLRTRLYGIWSVLTFTGVTILTVLLLAVIPGENRRRALVSRSAALALWLAGARLRVTGLEGLPGQPCVIVANHASYLDGIILSAALPPRFTFVIKKEMTRVPLANFLLKRIGSEFVDRSDRHKAASDTRRILQFAAMKQSIAFFPEGTFTPEPGLRRFHNGAFVAALRAELPVVPVVILGSRKMLPAGRLLPVPSRLRVVVKPAVETDEYRSSTDALMAVCRNRILESLDEPDLESPATAGVEPE
jgi:1-acyl-sn-glycerol-3-phosphate acyltransferase